MQFTSNITWTLFLSTALLLSSVAPSFGQERETADGEMFSPSLQPSTGPSQPSDPTRELRLLVILLYFQSDTRPDLINPDYRRDNLNRIFFKPVLNPRTALSRDWTVYQYLMDASHSVLHPTGFVTDWIRLSTPPVNAWDFNSQEAVTQVRLRYNLDRQMFDKVVYVARWLTPTDYALLGGSEVFVHLDSSTQPKVDVHELYHAIGLQHSNAPECTTGTFCQGPRVRGYGDLTDVMGNGFSRINPPQAEQLGWLRPEQVLRIERDGHYSIRPYCSEMTARNGGPNVLKLSDAPVSFGQPGYLYLTSRRPLNEDRFNLNGPPLSNDLGATIHNSLAQLLDARIEGGANDPNAYSLLLNQTAVTPRGTRITPISQFIDPVNEENSRLTVDIRYATLDFSGPDITPIEPREGEIASGSTRFRVLVLDQSGVSSVRLVLDGVELHHWVPASSSQSDFEVTLDTRLLTNGPHRLVFQATDDSCRGIASCTVNLSSQSTPISFVASNSDQVLPTISFSSPDNNGLFPNPVYVIAMAEDNHGMSRIELYINGAPTPSDVETCALNQQPSCRLSTSRVFDSSRLQTLRARAYDTSNNYQDTQVQFTAQADTTSPTTPYNLFGRVSANGQLVELDWGRSSDNDYLLTYKVFRDSQLHQSLVDEVRTSDAQVSGGRTYRYHVQACDRSGNCSAPSNQVVIRTP